MSSPLDSAVDGRQWRHPAWPVLRPRRPLPADRWLSRQADRDRRDRRRRPQHADSAAARVARGPGLRRGRDRLDAVDAHAADHRAGEGEQHAQQADLRPAVRHRFRRSPREGNHPGAQGRLRRALRSLHLHGAGARGRPRHRSAVAPQPLRLRDCAAPGLLPEGRRRNADRPGPRRARDGLLGIRDGPEAAATTSTTASAPIRTSCCASTRRWPTSSTSGTSTRAARSTTFRTNCASRSPRSSSRPRKNSGLGARDSGDSGLGLGNCGDSDGTETRCSNLLPLSTS